MAPLTLTCYFVNFKVFGITLSILLITTGPLTAGPLIFSDMVGHFGMFFYFCMTPL